LKILRKITGFKAARGNVACMQPNILLVTSNGIGMGHLARAVAIGQALKGVQGVKGVNGNAQVAIASMAQGISEVNAATGIKTFYIPGRDKADVPSYKWEFFLRQRILEIAKETNAQIITFDGVVPYPGVLAARLKSKDFQLVWIRRGFWQRKLHTLALGMQSRFMDAIIEPTDFASAADKGPTSKRTDAFKVAPISLFSPTTAQSKEMARKTLGLDLARAAVLVQLGTGEKDVNQKMSSVLKALSNWKDCQIVLTKEPKDSTGRSLAPAGLDLKIVRHFPLADLLHAFDGAVAAAGYNGVHELLAAAVPTVLVPNIRGTDDQAARAKWCADNGYAIYANQSELFDIETKVNQLQNKQLREELTQNCQKLPKCDGAEVAAKYLLNLTQKKVANSQSRQLARGLLVSVLLAITYVYRLFKSIFK
jgi:UDP-N-acetylglucosamine:LPS N-acetylglucosamine transferase